MVFGIGGGASQSENKSKQEVWAPQAQFLTDFWPFVQQLFQEQNQNIFSFGQGLSEEMTGRLDTASGAFESIMSGEAPGASYMQSRLSEANPYLGETIDAYGADIARNLAENILPELRSGGVAAGAPGGSRAYIAQGLAAQGAQTQFAQGASRMRTADLAQRDQMAGLYSSMQMQAAGGYAGLADQAYNLGMAPYSAAWMPALNYANILGSPTVLTESEGDASSFEFSI